MRISLLLKREPFGQIAADTLAGFCEEKYSKSYRVEWRGGRPAFSQLWKSEEQAWLCNIYLNAIFTPRVDAAAFDPIRREFARSLVRWRRPLQKFYVALAAYRPGAPLLAQASIGVWPPIPDDEHKLLVAGNHKLRILDHGAGVTYSILKRGFSTDFIERELSAREQAARVGLPVPELIKVAPSRNWFSEQYVSGTPINRVAAPAVAYSATSIAARGLLQLLSETAREESLDEYLTRLRGQIGHLIRDNHLLSEESKDRFSEKVEALIVQTRRLRAAVPDRVTTALAHGDFHPANILLNDDAVWLIDWEYSARRQSCYDALVFMLRSRSPKGLALRLRTFVTNGGRPDCPMSKLCWPGVDWRSPAKRRLYSSLFLLEELAMHLEENANRCFVRLGDGLVSLQDEIDDWIQAS